MWLKILSFYLYLHYTRWTADTCGTSRLLLYLASFPKSSSSHSPTMPSLLSRLYNKQSQIVLFSSTAIALYGYDQGMMSLINTNYSYLRTMGISEESPLVGIIVSVYYLGCTAGAVIASWFSDAKGRKPGIFACLATASLGNLIMFIAGFNGMSKAKEVMLLGRVVMGLGVGGIDAVVPVYSSELSKDDARGTALAQEFQANIFGLNMAFIVNVALTQTLGKQNEWAWRLPIIIMQVYPALLFAGVNLLPETPRWLVLNAKEEKAKRSIAKVFGKDEVEDRIQELKEAQEKEEKEGSVGYWDMCWPTGSQFHPTVVTVMGQVNQALTGYGAVSVYGPQIFELLGFGVTEAEYLTLGNYLFYFGMMTFAWLLIDVKGRRWLLVTGAFWLAISFAVLAVLGGLASHRVKLGIPLLATGIPGIVVLYLATAVFGIGWLVSARSFDCIHAPSIGSSIRCQLFHSKLMQTSGPTMAHPNRDLPFYSQSSRRCHLSDNLGPCQLRCHLAHTHRLQQPEVLPFCSVFRHKRLFRCLDISILS